MEWKLYEEIRSRIFMGKRALEKVKGFTDSKKDSDQDEDKIC